MAQYCRGCFQGVEWYQISWRSKSNQRYSLMNVVHCIGFYRCFNSNQSLRQHHVIVQYLINCSRRPPLVLHLAWLLVFSLLPSAFPRQDKDQRSLDMDTAMSMLDLLLGRTWPLFPLFHKFLEVPHPVQCIPRVHWPPFHHCSCDHWARGGHLW